MEQTTRFSKGITANAVAPGPSSRRVHANQPEQSLKIGEPEEIADAVAFSARTLVGG